MVDDIKSPRGRGDLGGSLEPKQKFDKKPVSEEDSIEATQAELQEKISQLGGDTTANDDEQDLSLQNSDEPKHEETIEDKIEEEFGPPPVMDDLPESSDKPSRRFRKLNSSGFWTLKPSFTRKQWLIYGGALGLTIIAAIVAFFIFSSNKTVATPPKIIEQEPVVTTVPSKLTGLPVQPEVNERQVTGVMIENSVAARPQSGLSEAGIVFEAIAEAGITRFLALYQDTEANYIGPVRSARPYFVQWCMAFDCAYAHVGGSPEALSDIKRWDVKDIDQFFGAQYYHRANHRYAPHNMYTSQNQLTKYSESRGYTASEFDGFKHLVEAPVIKEADITTKTINLNYPTGTDYDVSYSYDTERNVYLRTLGGKKHFSVNKQDKKMRNAPSVVIAMVMSYSLKSDGYHSAYDSVGTGRMYLFQNGEVISGQWSRESRDSPFVLTDKEGDPVALTPGQAWISVVGQSSNVTYR